MKLIRSICWFMVLSFAAVEAVRHEWGAACFFMLLLIAQEVAETREAILNH